MSDIGIPQSDLHYRLSFRSGRLYSLYLLEGYPAVLKNKLHKLVSELDVERMDGFLWIIDRESSIENCKKERALRGPVPSRGSKRPLDRRLPFSGAVSCARFVPGIDHISRVEVRGLILLRGVLLIIGRRGDPCYCCDHESHDTHWTGI